MNGEYNKIYNELIVNKSKSIIIDYNIQSKTYEYKPFSHKVSTTALDDLCELIIDNVVFYAYSENEIVVQSNFGQLNDLRVAAKCAFAKRLPKRINPKSDGTVGEVLLDLIIQVFEPTSQKLVARAKYTEFGKRKYEITGYDALYFTLRDEQLTLWLGQAKAGLEQYCKGDIKKDLNSKFGHDYFVDTAFYIADKSDSKELSHLLNAINKICFEAQKNKWSKDIKIENIYNLLKSKNVKIKIPCLLAYTNDIYSADELKSGIIAAVKNIQKYYDNQHFDISLDLPYEIRFYIFPIKDVSYIKNKLVDLKKEVVWCLITYMS